MLKFIRLLESKDFEELLLLAVIAELIPAYIAWRKGRSFWGWWIAGTVMWIIALPAALLASPNQAELDRRMLEKGEVRRCPHCKELVRVDATVCPHCRRDMRTGNASAS